MDGLCHILENFGWQPGYLWSGVLAASIGALYIAAAALSLHRACTVEPEERGAWWRVAVVLTLFSVGVLSGVPDAVTRTARAFAQQEGWYEERWAFQAWMCVLLCSCAAVLSVVGRGCLLRLSACCRPLFWFSLLAVFVALRAVSLHEVDALLQLDVGSGVQLGRLVEGALLLALIVALSQQPRLELAEPWKRIDPISPRIF